MKMTPRTFAACLLLGLGVVNAQRNTTVDDTDSAISYRGSWTRTNGTDPYKGSFQSSTEAGATATFTFTGVAVYYFMPLFDTPGVSTLLSLDSGPPQLVNLSQVGNQSTRSAVRWGSGDLPNGRHTLVSSVGTGARGAVDGFVYTVNESSSRVVTISCDDPRITYSPRGVWTTNTTNLPSCAISKSGVRVTSAPNATLNFDFSSDTVYLNTINTPKGGKLSLSVNGGAPQIYDTYASSTGCGISQPQKVTVNVRRDLLRPRSYSNLLTVKNVDGETQIDGITDGQNRPNAGHRVFMDGKFCAGTIFVISCLLLLGIA